ncbi:MAG: type II toxin-antitoxin system HicB family antitoxin, partial [Clostridia bacterium]
MKKVERYFYPAVFTYEPGQEIAVTFPDLGAATSGENEEDALLSARELLGCVLSGLEEDGLEIPAPT